LDLDPSLNDIGILNRALFEAAIASNKEMVDYLLFLGSVSCATATDINQMMQGAAYIGNRQLIEYALSLGCVSCTTATDLNNVLLSATIGGKIELLPYLIELGSVSCATAVNLDDTLYHAIVYDQFEIVKYLLIQSPLLQQQYPKLILFTLDQLEEDNVLSFVSRHGDLELVKHLLSLGLTDVRDAIITALNNHQLEVAKYLLLIRAQVAFS